MFHPPRVLAMWRRQVSLRPWPCSTAPTCARAAPLQVTHGRRRRARTSPSLVHRRHRPHGHRALRGSSTRLCRRASGRHHSCYGHQPRESHPPHPPSLARAASLGGGRWTPARSAPSWRHAPIVRADSPPLMRRLTVWRAAQVRPPPLVVLAGRARACGWIGSAGASHPEHHAPGSHRPSRSPHPRPRHPPHSPLPLCQLWFASRCSVTTMRSGALRRCARHTSSSLVRMHRRR